MEKELLSTVLQILSQLKTLHWQTQSYPEHVAFERTYESLGENFDTLIEVYSGKYQRPKFGGVKEITIADYDSIKVDAFLKASEEFFVDLFAADQDRELANIRDEIVADLQQLKYLLTLK
jgi:DNA-binding ferritin-like protein